jgi:AbrB family looped-hinge helix DNA binding protein
LPFFLLCANDSGVTLTVDRSGRLLLPRPVRERLGLKPGMELEASEIPEGLILRPAKAAPSMIRREGFWVHQGKLADDASFARCVADDREERMRRAGGW